tara:strand:+ start:82 stop:270 length:189 start_codon:yes stop_codon:yes gene_type:complete
MEVRKALAEALAAEVPPPALEDCEKKMHWAEAAQVWVRGGVRVRFVSMRCVEAAQVTCTWAL